MATTTLSAILAHLATVLETAPVSLTPTVEPFSHDRAPNTVLDSAYRLQDGGLGQQTPVGGYVAARIDRVTVFLAKKLNFAGLTSVETLETTLNTIERYLKAGGPAQGYHVEIEGRQVTRLPESDVAVASLAVRVDYDFNEATT